MSDEIFRRINDLEAKVAEQQSQIQLMLADEVRQRADHERAINDYQRENQVLREGLNKVSELLTDSKTGVAVQLVSIRGDYKRLCEVAETGKWFFRVIITSLIGLAVKVFYN